MLFGCLFSNLYCIEVQIFMLVYNLEACYMYMCICQLKSLIDMH